jgi:hypothetical protein
MTIGTRSKSTSKSTSYNTRSKSKLNKSLLFSGTHNIKINTTKTRRKRRKSSCGKTGQIDCTKSLEDNTTDLQNPTILRANSLPIIPTPSIRETPTLYYSIPPCINAEHIFFKETLKITSKETLYKPVPITQIFANHNITEFPREEFKEKMDIFNETKFPCGTVFDNKYIREQVNNNIVIFTCNSSGVITGICFLFLNIRENRNFIYITFICVPKEHKGTGQIILDKITDIANSSNAIIELTALNQTKLIEFYQRNGFQITNPECMEEDIGEPPTMQKQSIPRPPQPPR